MPPRPGSSPRRRTMAEPKRSSSSRSRRNEGPRRWRRTLPELGDVAASKESPRHSSGAWPTRCLRFRSLVGVPVFVLGSRMSASDSAKPGMATSCGCRRQITDIRMLAERVPLADEVDQSAGRSHDGFIAAWASSLRFVSIGPYRLWPASEPVRPPENNGAVQPLGEPKLDARPGHDQLATVEGNGVEC